VLIHLATYIGETGQWLSVRMKQHQYNIRRADDNSGMFRHLRKKQPALTTRNPAGAFHWNECKIIRREDNFYKRKIAEAIHIDIFEHGRQELMNIEDGADKDNRWALLYRNIYIRPQKAKKKQMIRGPNREDLVLQQAAVLCCGDVECFDDWYCSNLCVAGNINPWLKLLKENNGKGEK
jgi:hypothetical protein